MVLVIVLKKETKMVFSREFQVRTRSERVLASEVALAAVGACPHRTGRPGRSVV